MNETINVSIAGIGFKFEVEAYRIIKDYLDRIGRKYASDPDGEEILNDIEARVVEIILTEQSSDKIVSRPLIDMVVGRLGFPEEMESHEAEDPSVTDTNFSKRLYRNPEGAKAGGVISGLASFFRTDASLLRLAFFIPGVLFLILMITDFDDAAAFFGVLFFMFVILYILMWIVVPLARTPRQKLEMQGRRITASTIEEQAKQTSEIMPRGASRISAAFSGLFAFVGKLFTLLLKIFTGGVGAFFALATLGIITLMLYVAINGEVWFVESIAPERWFPEVGMPTFRWDIVIACVVGLIPAVMLSVAFLTLLAGKKVSYVFYLVLGALWLVAAGYSMVKVPQDIRLWEEYRQKDSMIEDLKRSGYEPARDAAGNIFVLQDTLYYAGEKLGATELAGRINNALEGEYEINIIVHPSSRWGVGGRSFATTSMSGPKHAAIQRMKGAGKQHRDAEHAEVSPVQDVPAVTHPPQAAPGPGAFSSEAVPEQ